ncbi:MAG: class I SAM-dependent methyltransferase [Ferruginibacter sp.]
MSSIITRKACPSCNGENISKVLTCRDHTVSKESFEIWECEKCSLRFTQHVPNQDSIGPFYQSDTYISHTDTEKGIINKLYKIARNYTLKWKMQLVKTVTGKVKTPGSLLDIGAGTGAFLQSVNEAGWTARGLEPDEGARKICLDNYKLQLDSPEKLFELANETFDAVTMWHVLEHVHQLHGYFQQIKRVLKQGGVALIALPNYTSLDATYYGANWAAYDVPRHLYHFSPASMETLVALHDMKLEAEKPMWLDAFYIAMLSEQYKSGKTNLLPAIWNGFKSNLKALQTREKCSSLVYIIRKD